MIISSSSTHRDKVHFVSRDANLAEMPISKVRALNIRAPQDGQSNIGSLAEDSPSDAKSNMAKSILEYVFLALGLLIITSIILRRCICLKRRGQPYTSFLHPNRTHATTYNNEHAYGRPSSAQIFSPHYTIEPTAYRRDLDVHLARYPAAYFGHGNRRTHAHDIDGSGRRFGHTTFLDHDGELGDKDALPAYDNYGGPPKYNELELQHRLAGVENGSEHPAGDQSSTRITGDGEGELPSVERQTSHPLSTLHHSNDAENSLTGLRVGPISTDS